MPGYGARPVVFIARSTKGVSKKKFKKSGPFRNRGWDSRFQPLFLSFSSTQKITNYKFNPLVFRFSADFRSFTSFKK